MTLKDLEKHAIEEMLKNVRISMEYKKGSPPFEFYRGRITTFAYIISCIQHDSVDPADVLIEVEE